MLRPKQTNECPSSAPAPCVSHSFLARSSLTWLDGCREWAREGMLQVKDGEGETDYPEDTRRSGAGVQNDHQHRGGTAATPTMTASPRSSLLSAIGEGWVPDMPARPVLRLIPVATDASARELPQLESSPYRCHVAHPTPPGGTASTSLLLRDLVPNQSLLALPTAHGAASPEAPTPPGQAVTRDMGAQTTPAAGETPLLAQLQHVFGAGT